MNLAHVRTNVFIATPFQREILLRRLVIFLSVALAIVPIVNMVRLLTTTGANNLGNDYLAFIGVIDKVLSGNYNWLDYFRDTFFAGAHSMAIPAGIILLTARFAFMNEYVVIDVGIVVAVFQLLVLFDIFTFWSNRWFKYLLLPCLSFLVFSNSQVSVFGFGMASPQIIISLFGFSLGFWGAVRFPNTWKGVSIIILGGFISAWSGGYGVAAWLFLFICLLVFGFRKPAHYLVWLVSGSIAALPYLTFFSSRAELPPNFLRIQFLLEMLGLPFATLSNLPLMERIGVLSILLAIPGIFFVWRLRASQAFRRAFPALILLGYSFVAIYQITIFRFSLAPWYTTISIWYWVAILGLAFALCHPIEKRLRSLLSISRYVWGLGVVAVLGYLFLTTNIDYLDKSMYLWIRRPVSSSCMLYYRTAPAYCEQYIYQWGLRNPAAIADLAEPLERHEVSTFAPHQIWTLQGDFGLSNVQVEDLPGIPNVFWSLDEDGSTKLNRTSWSDFRHLNLFLHTPNEISWTFALPANVEQAEFHSAVAISETIAGNAGADGITFEVTLQLEDGHQEVVFEKTLDPSDTTWEPFVIPLQSYAGHTITLHLSSDMIGNVSFDWAMYRYPYIDVTLDTTRGTTGTTLDLNQFLPKPTERDWQFNLEDWKTVNMQPGASANTWTISTESAAYTTTDICLSDYNYLYFRLTAPANDPTRPRYLGLAFIPDQPGGWTEEALTDALAAINYAPVQIPIYQDGKTHDYYYPIRLLEFDDPLTLRGIRLMPVLQENAQIKLEDFRLIRGSNADSRCPAS